MPQLVEPPVQRQRLELPRGEPVRQREEQRPPVWVEELQLAQPEGYALNPRCELLRRPLRMLFQRAEEADPMGPPGQ